MKRILKITILFLSCICACWLLPACSSDIEEPGNGGNNGSTVMLKLNAMVPGYETKADENSIPERERIEKLRIIVINKSNNEVEHNQLHEFPNREGSTYDIEVEKNSTKIVYFLANAENLGISFPKEGDIYDLEDEIIEEDKEDLIESQSETNVALFNQEIETLPEDKLPYTSKYVIEVNDKDITETCYIAIAAVKFDIIFYNHTNEDIKVNSLKISSIADRSFLFPHLNNENAWNDWIKSVISFSGKYITEYSVPEDAMHNDFIVPIGQSSVTDIEGVDNVVNNDSNIDSNILSFTVTKKENENAGSYLIPTFYCHESKNDEFTVEQHYVIQFEIENNPFLAEIKMNDNFLKSLIRSTHVKISININSLTQEDKNVNIYGEIIDWGWVDEVTGGIEEVIAP